MMIPTELMECVKNGDERAVDELFVILRRWFRVLYRRNGIVDGVTSRNGKNRTLSNK